MAYYPHNHSYILSTGSSQIFCEKVWLSGVSYYNTDFKTILAELMLSFYFLIFSGTNFNKIS